MENLLSTCCGSPAYAAPELICGKNYLGAEADLWSMGVLLYALLCGYLPFDDDNINMLYKKIQNGKYDLPAWLSTDSINLLNDLLQTDPKRRITMSQLVFHPWVLKGYSSSVDWQTRYYFKDLDRECLSEIGLYFGKSLKEITDHIQQWNYDFLTATYYLLVFMKMQGRQSKIKSNMKKYSQFITFANCTTTNATTNNNNNSTQSSNCTTTANRILIEKQLASLSTNGTPKIMNPTTNVKVVTNNVKIASKPPSQQPNDKNNENINHHQHQQTPQPKSQTNQVNSSQPQHNQKPKALFFDEIKPIDSKKQQQQQQREARPKTKPTTTITTVVQNQQPTSQTSSARKQTETTTTKAKSKSNEHSPESSTSSAASSSAESSESLSVSSSFSMPSSNMSDSNNFAMPSRITRNRTK